VVKKILLDTQHRTPFFSFLEFQEREGNCVSMLSGSPFFFVVCLCSFIHNLSSLSILISHLSLCPTSSLDDIENQIGYSAKGSKV
jgi:hypothetical protein